MQLVYNNTKGCDLVKKRDKTKAKKPIKWGKVTAVNKRSVAIYVVLRFLVTALMIVQLIRGNYDNVFLCLLTLVLFFIRRSWTEVLT